MLGNHNGIHVSMGPHKLPRAAWSNSIASKSALKFPAPNPCKKSIPFNVLDNYMITKLYYLF